MSWDGYVSYDGVLYGLPAAPLGVPPLAGTQVQVRERAGQVQIWSGGSRVLAVAKHTRSREIVPHPDQFRGIAPAAAARRASIPLGHRVPAPSVTRRDLREYDRLYGVELYGIDAGTGGEAVAAERAGASSVMLLPRGTEACR